LWFANSIGRRQSLDLGLKQKGEERRPGRQFTFNLNSLNWTSLLGTGMEMQLYLRMGGKLRRWRGDSDRIASAFAALPRKARRRWQRRDQAAT
jgi:hypothetical protein